MVRLKRAKCVAVNYRDDCEFGCAFGGCENSTADPENPFIFLPRPHAVRARRKKKKIKVFGVENSISDSKFDEKLMLGVRV